MGEDQIAVLIARAAKGIGECEIRIGLVGIFERNTALNKGLKGALVDISQSPYKVPRAFENVDREDRGTRAADALRRLEEIGIP